MMTEACSSGGERTLFGHVASTLLLVLLVCNAYGVKFCHLSKPVPVSNRFPCAIYGASAV